ncbi:alpha/beta hydrolase [Evansella sp. AB-rgal1]|uniref:alpha/beta hydrolase n=1 Tax=Evansella sp. AB-rgal1 TaxID=3242696 RepID=UPI00359EBF3A
MEEDYYWIEAIKKADFSFEEINPHFHHKALQSYLSHYSFAIDKVDEYRCGFEKINRKNHFYQFFLKNNPKGTIYLVHGYLDHSGGLSKTINYLLENKYQVIVLDLPGHGFSSGEKGMIASFDDYLIAVEKGNELIRRYVNVEEVVGLGHSTGAALLFHAQSERKVELDGLLLVAPLYYPFRWNLYRRFLLFSGKVVSQKKRSFKRNSTDLVYRQFVKHDPLQVKVLKANWVMALEDWQGQFTDCPGSSLPVYILQGTRDTTVDWKKNIYFYQEKCGHIQVALFEGARHQLLNERYDVRNLVQGRINSFLSDIFSPF